MLILFGFVFLLFAEGIFRARLLELEKENSQANGVSTCRYTCTCVLYVCSDKAKNIYRYIPVLKLKLIVLAIIKAFIGMIDNCEG